MGVKIGDKVVLKKKLIYAQTNPAYEKHNVDDIGTVIAIDESDCIDVKFDNCPCGFAYHGYCDGFPLILFGEIIELLGQERLIETSNICRCSSFDLTWYGHNVDCAEKKK